MLAESVRLFSAKGFHGTSIREIASAAGCSLPMLYYYYKNKDTLFYEVAYKELVALTERMNAAAVIGDTIADTYFNAMKLLDEDIPDRQIKAEIDYLIRTFQLGGQLI